MSYTEELRPYHDWIKENLGHLSDTDLSCRCTPVCEQMLSVFPELRIKSGHPVLADGSAPGEHTWLMTPDEKNIIDPTARQYHCGIAEYDADIYDCGEARWWIEEGA